MKIELLPEFKKTHIVLFVGTIVVIFAFSVGAVFASAATFKNFSSEFYIAGVDVSNKTLAESEQLILQKIKVFSSGVTVQIPGYTSQIISVPVGIVDVHASLAHARNVASRNALTRSLQNVLGMTERIDTDLVVDDAIDNVITAQLISSWNIPLSKPTNARFEITTSTSAITVIPSQRGQVIDIESLVRAYKEAVARGENKIVASIIETDPEITTADAEELKSQATVLADEVTKGRVLKIKDKTFGMTAQDLISLLQPRLVDGKPTVGIDAEILKQMFGKQLSQFEHEPKNAEFAYDGVKVTKFQPEQLGVAIDWDVLARDLQDSLSTKTGAITVTTKDAEPEIKLSSLNNLGINEVIGVGSSDFTGSPKNRIHNITTGMNSLKNVLIPPGETFSLIKTLGAIDGTTGYLEELVIKDNKTTPEFGGGLCQIGTTVFRAAMGAGFPIVERRNHSYQVGYYFENGVSGTDATIYDPKPDFRFKNDTGHWVLLDPHMDGTKLNFYFWGTSDGRKASRTVPKKLAAQPAPPKKEILTTNLPPGKVKCTEKAHAGATMVFTYSVEYPDGTVKKEDFTSFYKPWAEVCLIGIAPTSTPSGVPASSVNTPGIISPDAAGAVGN